MTTSKTAPLSPSPRLSPLGTFIIENDNLVVSDGMNESYISLVALGTWHALVERVKIESHNERSASLVLVHSSMIEHQSARNWRNAYVKAGVDSGYIAVFDAKRFLYADDDDTARLNTFRDWLSSMVYGDSPGGVGEGGVVVTSGLGDGTYPIALVRDEDGIAVGLRIDFTTDAFFSEGWYDFAHAKDKARMAYAIERGKQRERLEVGERVWVVEGSAHHRSNPAERCLQCPVKGDYWGHYIGTVAKASFTSLVTLDGSNYAIEWDCGALTQTHRANLAHE
jgi:hypothetical protein